MPDFIVRVCVCVDAHRGRTGRPRDPLMRIIARPSLFFLAVRVSVPCRRPTTSTTLLILCLYDTIAKRRCIMQLLNFFLIYSSSSFLGRCVSRAQFLAAAAAALTPLFAQSLLYAGLERLLFILLRLNLCCRCKRRRRIHLGLTSYKVSLTSFAPAPVFLLRGVFCRRRRRRAFYYSIQFQTTICSTLLFKNRRNRIAGQQQQQQGAGDREKEEKFDSGAGVLHIESRRSISEKRRRKVFHSFHGIYWPQFGG